MLKTSFYRSSQSCFSCLCTSKATCLAAQQEDVNHHLQNSIREKIIQPQDPARRGQFLSLVKAIQASEEPQLGENLCVLGALMDLQPAELDKLWDWSRHRSEKSWFRPFFTRSLSNFLQDLGYTQQECKAVQAQSIVDDSAVLAAKTVDYSPMFAAKYGEPPLELENATSLHLAILYDKPAILEHLLSRAQVDLNAFATFNNRNFTPLMLAAASRQTDMVQVLVAHGAQTDGLKNSLGHDALAVACVFCADEVVDFFLARGLFVPKGASHAKGKIEAVDNEGNTYLMLAVRGAAGQSESSPAAQQKIVDSLIKGWHVDVNQANAAGFTPLMVAAEKQPHGALVRRLLGCAGIDPNIQHPQTGETALILSAQQGNLESILLLASHPATDRGLRTTKGLTAADFLKDEDDSIKMGLYWLLEEKKKDKFTRMLEALLVKYGYKPLNLKKPTHRRSLAVSAGMGGFVGPDPHPSPRPWDKPTRSHLSGAFSQTPGR